MSNQISNHIDPMNINLNDSVKKMEFIIFYNHY